MIGVRSLSKYLGIGMCILPIGECDNEKPYTEVGTGICKFAELERFAAGWSAAAYPDLTEEMP
jgi:hypothetical protein